MNRFTLSIISLLLLATVGCSRQPTLKIGVSQCSDDDWRAKMNGEILREMMFHPEATVEILSAGDDSRTQISQIEYFIDNGFDIILVAPNEAEALTPVITKAYEQDIPVVVFDRKIKGESFTAFQGADNVDIGREAAEFVLSHSPPNPRIMEIHGLQSSTPALERHEGFVKRLAKAGIDTSAIRPFYGEWTNEDTYPLVKEALTADANVDVIFAHNDRMAIAAAKAAREAGIRPLIVGIDAAPEIGMKAVADSVIDATFLYPTEGARLVKTALAILEDQPYKANIEFPANPAVTHDNVGVLLLQNSELFEETERLEQLKTQLDDYWEKHSAQRTVLAGAIVILLLAFVVIFAILRAYWTHKRHRETLAAQNRQLAEQKDELVDLNRQLSEATQSKLTFFTNVSHDLRTPLTLIAEPVAQVAKGSNLDEQQSTLLAIAEKNIRILRRLINQVLDFRKYENDKLTLDLSEVNLGVLVSDWTDAFRPLAKKRHMKIETDIDTADTVTAVDAEKAERIFFNIVANAFKYTPDNGRIDISCLRRGDNIVLRITDNGVGIAAGDIKNVFDPFFQANAVNPEGSGIGLWLVKAFVELHGGTITVESVKGEGATFTVTFPVKHVADKPVDVTPTITEADILSELGRVEETEVTLDPDKPVLLVIDDNEDIRLMMRELLGDEYNVLAASNGRTGLKMASKYVPDAIVCDVMMPVMDGLECCRALKDEVTTSHIPVLMLTACSMDEQRVQGLESGADGYIAKPFTLEVLKAQIKNLLRNRALIKNILKPETATAPAEKPAASKERLQKAAAPIDNDFYRRFLDLVNRNLSDPSLNVESLASELGLARSQFYRKIKALTNFSPVELLRRMRLKQARELLTTTEKSISEIGYEVGFSSAAYFTKCYHDEYGETPSQLRERLGHNIP